MPALIFPLVTVIPSRRPLSLLLLGRHALHRGATRLQSAT